MHAIASQAVYYPPPFGDLPLAGKAMVVVLLVVSLGAHEAAHAWVALKHGDSTGRDLGRITLNPIPHIDPMMTIVVPVLMAMTTNFIFGGAKPVPVNFYNLRRPYRDMALVALAGPLSNVLCATALYAGLHVALLTGPGDRLLPAILYYAMAFNVIIAAFNLLPIPPLDGSRVMAWILPPPLRAPYHRIERFGLLLIVMLFVLAPRVLSVPVWNLADFVIQAIQWIVTLGGLW